jgi:hypothetical protein
VTFLKKNSSSDSWAAKNDLIRVECHQEIAKLQAKQNNYDEAIKHNQEIIRLYKRQSDYRDWTSCPYDRSIIQTNRNMSEMFRKGGKFEDAYKLQEENLKLIGRNSEYSDWRKSPMDAEMVKSYRAMSAIRAEQGKLPDAIKLQDQMHQLLQRKYYFSDYGTSEVDDLRANYHADVSQLYARAGDMPRAIAERNKEIALYKRQTQYSSLTTNSEDAKLFVAQRELIKCLKAYGKTEDALEIQSEQYRLLRRNKTSAKPAELAACCERIAEGYESIGRSERGISWRKNAMHEVGRTAPEYGAIRDRLSEAYKKVGKDLRLEEAAEAQASFAKSDRLEKFANVLSRLPRQLSVSVGADGTKLSTNDLGELLSVMPGTMLDVTLKEMFAKVAPPDEVDKCVSGVLKLIADTNEISFKGNRVQLERKEAGTIPFATDVLIAKIENIRFAKTMKFDVEVDPNDPTRISLNNIEGLDAEGTSGMGGISKPLKLPISSISVFEKVDASGKRNRILSVGGIDKIIAENVSEEESKAFQDTIKLASQSVAKLGKGDISGVIETMSGSSLDTAHKAILSDISSIRKVGRDFHLDLRNGGSYRMSSLANGATINGDDPIITIDRSVDLYIPSSTYSLDLSSISGLSIKAGGKLGGLFGSGGIWNARLEKLYFGGNVSGNRALNIGFDNGIKSLWVDVTSTFAPAPNSTLHLTLNNPIGGKRESVSMRFDGTGKVKTGDAIEEGAYLFLEGLRRGWLPD